MGKTSIEWTDRSVNPIRFGRGHYCQKISPGCANCYASRFQPRVGNDPFGGVGGKSPVVIQNGVTNGQYLWLDESKLKEVLRLRKPQRIFWCDMTDLFGEWVPDAWIDLCFAVMALTPHHTHQVLTKRADQMADYCKGHDVPAGICDAMYGFDPKIQRNIEGWDQWPIPNVWLGVSCEDQKRTSRIDVLRTIPAAVRFLSIEPLLEDVGELDLTGIHWVIVGGESGPEARDCDLESVFSLIHQCREVEVPVFVKQLGAKITNSNPFSGPWPVAPATSFSYKDRKGGDPSEWPAWAQVREFPRIENAVTA